MASRGPWSESCKNILNWSGQDCVSWARQVCDDSYLDASTCDEERILQLTGPQLLSLTTEQLELFVGVINAPHFREHLDNIFRWLRNDFGAGEVRSCKQQFDNGSHWSDFQASEETTHLYDMDPKMVAMGMCHGPDGYLTKQYLGTSSQNNWHSRRDSRCSYNSGFGEGDIFYSMPWTTTDNRTAPLSLPTPELPLLDALTVADILDENSSSLGNSELEPHEDWAGGQEARCTASIRQATDFGTNLQKRRGTRGLIKDPPLFVPNDILESEKWFEPYTCDRNRIHEQSTLRNPSITVRRPEVWEYILRLLQDPRTENQLVEWVDRPRGVFKIIQRQQVARMWRDHWHKSKRGTPVNYENFGKCLRPRVLVTPHTSFESLKAKLQRKWEAIPLKQNLSKMSVPISEVEITHQMDSANKTWAMYYGFLGDDDSWARPPSEFDVHKEPTTQRHKLRARTDEFLDSFTVHGPARIRGAQHILRRLVWLVFFLVCFVYGLLQCWKVYQEYISYPKSVTIELKYESPVMFPAVTLCNLNPINNEDQLREHNIYAAFISLQEENTEAQCENLTDVVDDPLDSEICNSFDEDCDPDNQGFGSYYEYDYLYDYNYDSDDYSNNEYDNDTESGNYSDSKDNNDTGSENYSDSKDNDTGSDSYNDSKDNNDTGSDDYRDSKDNTNNTGSDNYSDSKDNNDNESDNYNNKEYDNDDGKGNYTDSDDYTIGESSSIKETTTTLDETTANHDETTTNRDETSTNRNVTTTDPVDSSSNYSYTRSSFSETSNFSETLSSAGSTDTTSGESTSSTLNNSTDIQSPPVNNGSSVQKRRKRSTNLEKQDESSSDSYLEDLPWFSYDGNFEQKAKKRKLSRQRRIIPKFPKYMNYNHMMERSQCSFVYQYSLKLAIITNRSLTFMDEGRIMILLAAEMNVVVGDFSNCESKEKWINNPTSRYNVICKKNVYTDPLGKYMDVDKEYVENEVDSVKVELSCAEGTFNKSKVWKKQGERKITAKKVAERITKSRANDLSDILRLFSPDIKLYEATARARASFVQVCSIDGTHCNYKQFHAHTTNSMGVCYTFNSPHLNDSKRSNMTVDERRTNFVPRKSFQTGPQGGLSLTLNLYASKYLSLLSPKSGVRVVLHQPWEAPFPANQGFDVAPGMSHSIAVKRKVMQRIGPPHGNCKNSNDKEFDYTEILCKQLCFEREVRRKCQCFYNEGHAYDALNREEEFAGKTFNMCDAFAPVHGACLAAVSYISTTDVMNCNCHPPCTEVKYSALASSTAVNKEFLTTVQNVKRIPMGVDLCGEENSTVRLHIYMESNSYEEVKESPAYTWTTLISNMGGNMGLFIGMSLVSGFELLDYLFDVLLILVVPSCYECLQGRSAAVEMVKKSPKKVVILAGPPEHLPHGKTSKMRPLRSRKLRSGHFNQIFMSD
ncbi:Ets domain [Trinorchestia longiramus]|nr:Ets domain [Trinorchestia longiramus]